MLAKLAAMFKKTTQHGVFSILLMLILIACQPSSPSPSLTPQTDDIPLATVGEITINQADIDAEFVLLPESIQEHIDTASYQQHILQTLIRRAVLSQRAKDIGLDKKNDIRYQIERNRNSILIAALRNWKIKQLPTPQASLIADYYQEHLQDFSIPEQVHARHILVYKQKKAQWIYAQLKHKKDSFKHLVTRYSLDDSTNTLGGDLNWFSHGIMVPNFDKAVFALKKPGDISHPIQTTFGWHIIELMDRHAASQTPLSDVHDEIIQILRQKNLDQWVNDLVKESAPELHYTPDLNKQ